jgi:hypothetical protein
VCLAVIFFFGFLYLVTDVGGGGVSERASSHNSARTLL